MLFNGKILLHNFPVHFERAFSRVKDNFLIFPNHNYFDGTVKRKKFKKNLHK
jgi:hypothetical protein